MAKGTTRSTSPTKRNTSVSGKAREFTSPTDGFTVDDKQIEAMLLSGENAGLLTDYFGAEQYAELRGLARQLTTRAVRGGERVLILPGIMGSKLGYPLPLLDDVIWFAPLALAAGRLDEIRLPAGDDRLGAVGVILLAYLSLKLRLQLSGYDADFHAFDWRRSLNDLGKDLAKRINGEEGPVKLVAHSMGGLVARACLAHEPRNLQRIIMLGTPNYGSYAPVQAFRGAYSTVEKIAWLDRHHSSDQLAEIFGTFPGLLEMVPAAAKVGSVDLFDLNNWPSDGVRPDEHALANARTVQNELPTSARGVDIILVAGVNQQTVVDAKVEPVLGVPGRDEFVYSLSGDGDGTVPLRCCLLPDARTYYVEAQHGSLPSNSQVQLALPSLLATGLTDDLASVRPALRTATERIVRESEVSANVPAGRTTSPGMAEMRDYLSEFVAPAPVAPSLPVLPDGAASGRGTSTSDDEAMSDTIVFGRGRPFRLEITVAKGSIATADAQCYVLGMFRNVEPAGAALALDEVMEGAVTNMVRRRMFNGNVGEITMLPTGRHPIHASNVAFIGLGSFDSFQTQTLETVGENLSRVLVAGRVDDIAMVPFGAGSGEMPLEVVRRLLRGFLRGIRDADLQHRFREIKICENDQGRYEQIRRAIYELAGTKLFDDVELTLSACVLPEPAKRGPRSAAPRTDRVFLIVREGAGRLGDDESSPPLVASLLTSGAQAAIVSGLQPVYDAKLGTLEDHLRKLGSIKTLSDVADFGETLGKIVLAPDVRAALRRSAGQHLVVVHDAAGSRIPWEALQIDGYSPALGAGMSHRYEATDLSVAKFLDLRRRANTLRLLVVADPLGDLPYAAREGDRIMDMASGRPGISARILRGAQARKSELLAYFSSGEFDVIHYAGHAFFDPLQRGRSGLACAGREILSGDDLTDISNLPSLMFFNACQAARIRHYDPDFRPVRGQSQLRESRQLKKPNSEHVRRGIGFAESILRGGIANFVGTYWPVGDLAAGQFAETFYPALFGGSTISSALNTARAKVREISSPDWADYVFYGDPDFALKELQTSDLDA